MLILELAIIIAMFKKNLLGLPMSHLRMLNIMLLKIIVPNGFGDYLLLLA